jgi:hypothetical protein
VNLAVLAVNGEEAHRIHRSVLERAAEIAGRLGCGGATRLADPPVTYADTELRLLRRDLDEVIAFADASGNTGWVLGDVAAAPGDEPVQVLRLPEGVLWADAVRGFELHGTSGVRRVTECPGGSGPARRVALPDLLTPLVESVARAEVLDVYACPT